MEQINKVEFLAFEKAASKNAIIAKEICQRHEGYGSMSIIKIFYAASEKKMQWTSFLLDPRSEKFWKLILQGKHTM